MYTSLALNLTVRHYDRLGYVPTKRRTTLKSPHRLNPDAALQVSIGAVIRESRRKLGISQEELAFRADLHRTYISDIERGERNVTLQSLANLARALQIPVGRLFEHLTSTNVTAPVALSAPIRRVISDIWLIENDHAAAAATAEAFKMAGLTKPIRVLASAEAALTRLFGTDGGATHHRALPHLILLVSDLPGISATEFLARIKREATTRNIPVVMLKGSGVGGRGIRHTQSPGKPEPPKRPPRRGRARAGKMSGAAGPAVLAAARSLDHRRWRNGSRASLGACIT